MTIPDDGSRRPLHEALEPLTESLRQVCSSSAFNGTVLVAHDGRVVLQQHYGFADAVGRVPLSPRSSFLLGGVSKPFTALAILMLARAGKLTLEDPLSRHIPEFAGYRGVTLRYLLHHTSGIPDYVELADDHGIEHRLVTMPDVIGLFVKHRPRSYFAPGDRFEYSNTGYALLGEIVARASGTSYPAFMAEAIFKPLGMNDSAAYNLSCRECPLPFRVFGSRRSQGRVVSADLNLLDGIFGDGGIYASAEDLVRWDAALRQGTLIPRDAYEQAYVPGKLNDGTSTGYGFGWEIEPNGMVEHWGELPGFSSFVLRDLAQHSLLTVLSNVGPASAVDPVCQELVTFFGRIDWSDVAAIPS